MLRGEIMHSLHMQLKGLAEVLGPPDGQTLLEVGPGGGFFKLLMDALGYTVLTADIREEFQPDFLGDFRTLEFDRTFDAVVAFEVLQHMPYSDFGPSLSKMAELSDRYVYLSLPSQVHSYSISVRLPDYLLRKFLRRFRDGKLSLSVHMERPHAPDILPERWDGRPDFWNPHYWEVGRRSYPKKRVLGDIRRSGLHILSEVHSRTYPYHYFILCDKRVPR